MREDAKEKKNIRKRKKRNKKKADREPNRRLASGPRMLADDEDDKKEELRELTIEQKQQIRKKLSLETKIDDTALSTDGWDAVFIAESSQQKLRDLCKACGVSGNGGKAELLARVIEWCKGN
eukprot:TRINITY_DN41639_c0_g1_i1.p3 TRINITY_DN41639_c0_g1~~TRINITY_DN41639_c0_g1_i1.p3  ORF type:complete len:122 (-),score=38.66 TRINITY_DN41639_c0_g1_i1:436-801(-)